MTVITPLVEVPKIPKYSHLQAAVLAIFCRPQQEVGSLDQLFDDIKSNCGYEGTIEELKFVLDCMVKSKWLKVRKPHRSQVLIESKWEPTVLGYDIHAEMRKFYKVIHEHAIA